MVEILEGAINERGPSQIAAGFYGHVLNTVSLLPHPLTCVCHVAFKAAIIVAYCLFPYIIGTITGCYPDYIFTFVIIALLVLSDYWVVKNCTSSTLAGIAWYCDTSVSNEFVHKTVKDSMFLNQDEVKLFWAVVYAWPAPWILNVLFRLSTIDIPWAILSLLILGGALLNLMNCLKCSQEKRTTASQLTGKVAGKFMNFVMNAKNKNTIFPQ